MKLMITAEDFGLTKGINYGILDACENGIVTTVSLLINTNLTDHALDLIKSHDVGIGLSLNVTYGKPLAEVTVLMEYGFLKPEHELNDDVLSDIRVEYRQQILKAKAKGIDIRFLTTYGKLHLKERRVFEILVELGHEFSIPVRGDYDYSDVFHGQRASADTLFMLFQQKVDWLELVVTPGFLCGQLIEISTYREMRVVEHSILVNPYVKQMIENEQVELVNRVK